METAPKAAPPKIYTMDFMGETFRVTTVGVMRGFWMLESFSLEHEIREQIWHVMPGDVVLDIGAGFGSYTLTALARGASLVLAAEPAKEELFSLAQNVALNPGWSARCACVPLVFSDRRDLMVSFSEAGHSCLRPDLGDQEYRLTETADEYILKTTPDRLDWLKIDVEGMESWVLRGAVNVLKILRPKVLVEIHQTRPDKSPEIVSLMEGLGYSCRSVTGSGVNDHWQFWEHLS